MRALVLLLAACALGGGEGGGSADLPISGAGPFAKLEDFAGKTPLDEPFVVFDGAADVADPAPLVLPGGAIRIFYTRSGRDLYRVDLPPSLREEPSDPELVLAGASAPSAVRPGSTAAGALVLYYETPDGIARAVSSDDGATVSPDGLVLAGAAQPGAVVVGDTVFLYHTRRGDPSIWVASSTDGRAFTVATEPALVPRHAFEALGLAEPAAAGGTTAAGEPHVGLYYVGTNAQKVSAIGYAGSRDGLHFTSEAAPILDPGAPDERGPAALLFPTRAVLFFTQNRSGKLAIGAATQ